MGVFFWAMFAVVGNAFSAFDEKPFVYEDKTVLQHGY